MPRPLTALHPLLTVFLYLFLSHGVYTCLTPGSVEPRRASASVAPHFIFASGTIQTWVRLALVLVDLAGFPAEPAHTITPEEEHDEDKNTLAPHMSNLLFNAYWSVLLQKGKHLHFAHSPEVVDSINTRSSVQTGSAIALVHIHFTALPSETLTTWAGISSPQVLTHSSILARPGLALVYLQLTTSSYKYISLLKILRITSRCMHDVEW